MNEIKMNRKELLKIVKENMKKHLADYAEAVEDYKAGALKVATSNLKIRSEEHTSELQSH